MFIKDSDFDVLLKKICDGQVDALSIIDGTECDSVLIKRYAFRNENSVRSFSIQDTHVEAVIPTYTDMNGEFEKLKKRGTWDLQETRDPESGGASIRLVLTDFK